MVENLVFFFSRRACQLLKIANAMPTGVSSLKHTSSYVELERELESLPGYNKQAAQLFLRYDMGNMECLVRFVLEP